jgi:GNAT superfamily N-acetyltransferase
VGDDVPVLVRRRAEADLDACAEMVRAVHDADGYPHFVHEDFGSFLVSPGELGAWVAEHGGRVAGHVALRERGSGPVMEAAAAAIGQPPGRLAVVTRLFVSPDARRLRIGRSLLAAAADEAYARGLWPVVDVAADLAAAIRLYEACGWVRAGAVTVQLSHGSVLDEFVYLGPPPTRR